MCLKISNFCHLAAGRFVGIALMAMASAHPAIAVEPQPPHLASLLSSASFTLGNGLKVVVHEDHKTPLVTVQVLYRVGSLDEPSKREGFAHLFEHLMFTGTTHYNSDYIKALNALGSTDYNGTTNLDRTVYYETVRRSALEQALFLESDRMGFLSGALTQAKLDNQVDVVLNEKRQNEDRPYGNAWQTIFADLYPPDHPYHHSTIGNEVDLKAATMIDVRAWYARYYGAGNAVLILTGDIDATEARRLSEKYFGEIPAGPALARPVQNSQPLAAPVIREMQARVATPRLYRQYIAPPMGGPDGPALELAAHILGNGMTSRLRRRLVDELGLATSVTLTFGEGLLSSQLGFIIDTTNADTIPRASRELDAMLAEFARTGPTLAELRRARTVRTGAFARFVESSFGQNIMLARGEFFTGNPDYYGSTFLSGMQTATVDDLRDALARVVTHGYSQLTVLPLPVRTIMAAGYDRSRGMPPAATAVETRFPTIQEARLANGMKVVFVHRDAAPTVTMLAQFNRSGAENDTRNAAAIDQMAAAMMTRGAGGRDERAIAAATEEMGGELSVDADKDMARIGLSVLMYRLPTAMGLFADVIERPDFPADALKRYREQRLAGLTQETSDTGALGIRAMKRALYGPAHPYGAGTRAEEVAATTRVTVDDLRRWYLDRFRPENGTLFVVGATTLDRLMPLLEARLGQWRPAGRRIETTAFPIPSPATTSRLIVIDMPGVQQTQIFAGRLIAPTGGKDDPAIAVTNLVYGGDFAARIGSSLRGEKGWSYGIGSGASDAAGPRLMLVAGSVQANHTGDSVAELIRQMTAMGGDQPPSAAELTRIATTARDGVAGRLETAESLATAMAESAAYHLPYDHAAGRGARYAAVTQADAVRVARSVFDPAAMTWVLVGDAKAILPQLTALNLGKPEIRSAQD